MAPLSRKPRVLGPPGVTTLSDRQAMVLRALVATYVGQAGPVASSTLSQRMPTRLSPASIRNTLGELHELGLIDKAHASAGRVPTAAGLRVFVDLLLEVDDLGPHHRRLLDREFDRVEPEAAARSASQLLSEHTRQLGFVVAPRVERLRLQTIHLVPVAAGRILAVIVARNGAVIERLIEALDPIPPRELERVQAALAARVEGRTLVGLRRLLEEERDGLRGEADAFLRRVWRLGLQACERPDRVAAEDLVIATRLALLDQPEFSDPERIRGLFAALETHERLLALLHRIADTDADEPAMGLSISLGEELGEPALRDCALVAVPYGAAAEGAGSAAGHDATGDAGSGHALGVLGVIGPQRMDYGHVLPLVHYCSELVTRKLRA
jgi:heat-inducible transcriptional repressor